MADAPSGKGLLAFFRLFKKDNLNEDDSNILETRQQSIQEYITQKNEINMYEDELLLRSITFKEKIINDILTPRTKVVAIDVNETVDKVRDIFLNERYSRIPVYDQDIDHIIGILSEREFLTSLLQEQEVDIRKLIRIPIFIMETMKISTVLTMLQKENGHLAIVIDEFGGTSGIVTLEDILEELVGEIRDEFDELENNEFIQVNEYEYQFQASMSLSNFFPYCKNEHAKEPVFNAWWMDL
ncbi:CBS domain-containing protein [Gottfriedia sp. OAE603]|uniref:CBS domain-containing protein n=1 Tax=Gottfriedia sp. OAE603 TaxID=2663872 RepID=UPI00347735D9